ncbi:MAG: PEP-CTERM sorting domain-containing protein, partial [Aestuariibacter sp.]|nr:PEP-CTERM sorting domain-containing protein [Aestuariibacter sp.]
MNKFSSFTKALSLTAAVVLGSTNVANAASITFGGVAASDNSGLTSSFIDPITGGLSGYFIETFDVATGDPSFPGST